MDRWKNKVAVVTGASAGIGAVIARDLVQAGLIVVALARREEILRQLQQELPSTLQNRYFPVKCDITNESDVIEIFTWIEDNLGGVDILVNNAGIVITGVGLTSPYNTRTIRDVVETNLMSVVYCTREAFNSMKKRGFDGHIVILNSVAGHKTPNVSRSLLNIYPGTKHAVTTMVESYRQEFMIAGTKVKITSISPGAVETAMIPNLSKLLEEEYTFLKSEDVSNAIFYALSAPPHVQIHEIILTPIGDKAI